MSIAAAYIRVSTDEQIEFSPDSQLKALKSYAEKNSISLPDEFIFIDEGISGRNTKKRTAFNRMIAFAKSKPKPFDVILVWKYSRFARNREDSVVYKSMLRKELGIDVISISEDVGDDKMSVLFEAMIEAMDEYYSINLAEEVKRGMTEKAKRGGVLSVAPFGYAVMDGQYVIVPDEAAVIKKVFYDYAQGKGFLGIAKELNRIGIRTHRGNRIENRTIEYWLNNPVYIGKIRWNPDGALSRNYNAQTAIITEGKHEAVIDTAVWELVQEKIKKQKERCCKYYTSERKDISHWLVGIVRCEKCGAVLSNQNGYFGCSKRGKGLCEGNGYISVKKLEKMIACELSGIFLQDVQIQADTQIELQDENTGIFKNQIKKLELRLNRIKSAYENGIDTLEEYKENKASIMNELEEVKKEMEAVAAVSPNQSDNIEIMRFLDILNNTSISNTNKNKAVRAVFKEIINGGEEGDIIKCVFYS